MNWIILVILTFASFILMKLIIKATKVVSKVILFLAIFTLLFYFVGEYSIEKLTFKLPVKDFVSKECNDSIECVNSSCITESLNATFGRCDILTNSSCVVILNGTKTLFCPDIVKPQI